MEGMHPVAQWWRLSWQEVAEVFHTSWQGVQADKAVHILDRFHFMVRFNKALDEVRADEARQLKRDEFEPVLKHSRWCLLKRPENLTPKQVVKLAELMKFNLRSVRSHLQREEFQRFWEYVSPSWAGKFLDEWCTRTMRSRLEPMKRVAQAVRIALSFSTGFERGEQSPQVFSMDSTTRRNSQPKKPMAFEPI